MSHKSNLSIAKKMREIMSGQKSPFFEKEQGAYCHVPTRSVTNLLLFSHSAFEQRRFLVNHTGSNVKRNCKILPRIFEKVHDDGLFSIHEFNLKLLSKL